MTLPLLMDELQPGERASLAALQKHPGFSVLEKLMMAACKRATEDVIQLNPADEGYERKLKALQGRARERNEFFLLVLGSVSWQVEAEAKAQEEKTSKPEGNRILRTNK